jgi:predicted Rossmann-fold nucleotide-binding protein
LVADGVIDADDPDRLRVTDDPEEVVRIVCETRDRQEP